MAPRRMPQFALVVLVLLLTISSVGVLAADAGAGSAAGATTGSGDAAAPSSTPPTTPTEALRGAVSPDGGSSPVTASPAQVEALVAALEDPQARSALVQELRLLMEAQGRVEDASASGSGAVPDPGFLIERVQDELLGVVDRVRDLDPVTMVRNGLLTLLIVGLVLMLRVLARRGLRALAAWIDRSGAHADEDAAGAGEAMSQAGHPGAGARLLLGLPMRLLDLLFLVGTALAVLELWQFRFLAWLRGTFGEAIIERLVAIAFVILIVVVLWLTADSLIERFVRLRRSGSPRSEDRARTLVPLMKGVAHLFIGAVGLLMLLAELGVNVGPLIASAGILGLAVGLGAQTLIKDLLVGATIVLEDAVSVGDVIQIGDHMGSVEEMKLRILRLRDIAGVVHYLPYSEVGTIRNYTKDFAYALLDVGVAYREDAGEVIALLKEAGDELAASEAHGADIIGETEVMGVQALADSSVVVRVRLRTQPLARWTIERALRQAIKERLDAAGVEIPFPHTTLWFGQDKDGSAPPVPLPAPAARSGPEPQPESGSGDAPGSGSQRSSGRSGDQDEQDSMEQPAR